MKAILVRGGAGGRKNFEECEKILEKAAKTGLKYRNAITMVEKAINVLEDSGLFNAGKGAVLQIDGKVRLDASIMSSNLKCGAVCCLEGIKHAISIARLVMEKTNCIMLSSRYATKFAEEFGFRKENLRTSEKIKLWNKIRKKIKGLTYKDQLRKLKLLDKYGTVGAVAIDKKGRIAAGTSTGGRSLEIAGRVGDTPLIGCGTYCNEFAGASATGIGEDIIKVTLARKACDYVEEGLTPQQAAEKAISKFEEKTKSKAGIIVMNRRRNYGVAYNTKCMPICFLRKL